MLNVVKKQSIGVPPDRKTAGVRITITRAAEKGIRGNLNIARGLFGNSLLWLITVHSITIIKLSAIEMLQKKEQERNWDWQPHKSGLGPTMICCETLQLIQTTEEPRYSVISFKIQEIVSF